MKRNLKFTGLALATIMTISAVSIPVQAADEGCQHPHLSFTEETDCDYTDFYCHTVTVTTGYKCDDCNRWKYITSSSSYKEDHDYEMDSSGVWRCECGDYYYF